MFTYTHAFSGFSVNNLQNAKEFYTSVLNLTVQETSEGLMLDLGGGLHIFIYEKQNHLPATYTILNFEVGNIDQAVEQLKNKGVVFEQYEGMTDEKGIARGIAANRGPDIAWFKDPAGNFLSVLKNK